MEKKPQLAKLSHGIEKVWSVVFEKKAVRTRRHRSAIEAESELRQKFPSEIAAGNELDAHSAITYERLLFACLLVYLASIPTSRSNSSSKISI